MLTVKSIAQLQMQEMITLCTASRFYDWCSHTEAVDRNSLVIYIGIYKMKCCDIAYWEGVAKGAVHAWLLGRGRGLATECSSMHQPVCISIRHGYNTCTSSTTYVN